MRTQLPLVSLMLTLLVRILEEYRLSQAHLSLCGYTVQHIFFFSCHCNDEFVASMVTSFSFLTPVVLTT